jgi:hypothetical protein
MENLKPDINVDVDAVRTARVKKRDKHETITVAMRLSDEWLEFWHSLESMFPDLRPSDLMKEALKLRLIVAHQDKLGIPVTTLRKQGEKTEKVEDLSKWLGLTKPSTEL